MGNNLILIDALFINKGGGAVLLQYLIESILETKDRDRYYFLLDPRFDIPPSLHENFRVIPNNMKERKRFYKETKFKYSKVFCFANTPPPIKLGIPVYTYMHNQKLLEAPFRKFEGMYRKQYLKYLFIKWHNRNTDYYIVQTPHMVDALVATGLKDKKHCLSIPFYDNRKYAGQATTHFSDRPKNEFVFISNPSPQKNYPTLLDAWEILLQKGITPKLHVTVDDTAPQLLERIKTMNDRGTKIINHEYVDPRELYFNCPWLIFPSVIESFGLPLIEAAESGMKIVASDLPFVHDVVSPSLTFDPLLATSIADAVLQAIDNQQLPVPTVTTQNKISELLMLLSQ